MIHTRRKFLTGLGSLLAAPAIVHAGNLMPVKALPKPSLVGDIFVYGRSPAMDALAACREFDVLIRTIYGFNPQVVTEELRRISIDDRYILHIAQDSK